MKQAIGLLPQPVAQWAAQRMPAWTRLLRLDQVLLCFHQDLMIGVEQFLDTSKHDDICQSGSLDMYMTSIIIDVHAGPLCHTHICITWKGSLEGSQELSRLRAPRSMLGEACLATGTSSHECIAIQACAEFFAWQQSILYD